MRGSYTQRKAVQSQTRSEMDLKKNRWKMLSCRRKYKQSMFSLICVVLKIQKWKLDHKGEVGVQTEEKENSEQEKDRR